MFSLSCIQCDKILKSDGGSQHPRPKNTVLDSPYFEKHQDIRIVLLDNFFSTFFKMPPLFVQSKLKIGNFVAIPLLLLKLFQHPCDACIRHYVFDWIIGLKDLLEDFFVLKCLLTFSLK